MRDAMGRIAYNATGRKDGRFRIPALHLLLAGSGGACILAVKIAYEQFIGKFMKR
jgi:hypothetical protein